jgi:hypothetical protein
MKKIFTIALIIISLVFAIGYSQTVIYTNQKTVTWDLSTKLDNGQPIPVGDKIEYEVYLKNRVTSVEILLTTVALPPYTVTLPTEGKYLVGVRAKRTTQSEVIYSEMNWSDNATLNPNTTFELRFFVPAEIPKGMKVQ